MTGVNDNQNKKKKLPSVNETVKKAVSSVGQGVQNLKELNPLKKSENAANGGGINSNGGSLVSSALPAAAGLAGAGAGVAAAGAGAGLGILAGTVGALVSAGNYIEARKKLETTLNEEPQYEQSEELRQALEGLKQIENSKPGEYQSAYADEIRSLLTEIKERPEFSYDFTKDPLYMQYRDQYVRNGRLAMEDTAANAAALTGGYGNSWAATAGSLAFQSYLDDLNSVIPELEEKAFDRWQQQGNEKMQRAELLSDLDSVEYGRWQDAMDSYYRDLEYAFDKAQTLEERDWKMYLESLDQWGFKTEFYDDMAKNAFGQAADSVGMITDSFGDIGKAVSDAAWSAADLLEEQRQFNADMDYKRDKAALDHSEWQSEFNRTLERDARSDYEWDTKFDYQQQRDARSDYEWDAEFGYKKSRDAVKDAQWQSELDEKIREFNIKNYGETESSPASSFSSSSKSETSASKTVTAAENTLSDAQIVGRKAGGMSTKELDAFYAELYAEQRDDVKKRMLESAYANGKLTYAQYEEMLNKLSL